MLQAYSIFDKKAASFERPFWCKHVAEATRAIQMNFEAPKGQEPWFVKYPADFALYHVGNFDPTTGSLLPTAHMGPQIVIEIASLAPHIPSEKVGA